MRFTTFRIFLATLAIAFTLAPPAVAAPSPVRELSAITLAMPSPASNLSALTLAADNVPTNETLVLSSAPTQLHTYNFRHQILIKNNGPNRIWCAVGPASLAVVGKAIPLDAGGGWISLPLAPEMPVWCIAETANQITHAATTTLEVP